MAGLFAENGGSFQSTLPLMGPEELPKNVKKRFASYSSELKKEANEDL